MAATRRTSIERILCPIDFSDISYHALAHAAAIARWYEARLTLLYVFVNLPALDLPPLVLEEGDRARLFRQMRAFADILPPEVQVDCQLQEERLVHDAILAQVADTQADLLVLGTHGRSGFQRLFLGSVTEKVIRKVKCPTLIVPPRAPDIAPGAPVEFHRVLCPIDFSDGSLAALEYAINLSEEADGQLTLLHVTEMPAALTQEPFVVADEIDRIREAAATDARRKLANLIPENARAYCTIDTAVVEGRAYREILRRATEKKTDLIVMGVHGRGALDLLLFGSTTHHVIRASACPVLIVRQE
ncbi:MAG: universal stress protein [Vicinamibacterales bacterium]